MELHLKLAGVPFCACVLYAETAERCAAYQTDEPPEFTIKIDRATIEAEREIMRRCAVRRGMAVLPHSPAELESNALYRLSAERLSPYRTVLVHGSAVALDGEACLFVAPSGTGKSTHTRLWREVFGERAVMVNDDKPILRSTEAGILACGTPWNGKHRLGSNLQLPLKAICFLHRCTENRIEPVDGRRAFLALLQASYRPLEAEAERLTLKTLETLYRQLPFYQSFCNQSPEAAIISYRGIFHGTYN